MFFATTVFIAALLANVGVVSAAPSVAITNGTLLAQFGVNTGTQGDNDVAWIDGQSPCNNVIISASGTNPCGRSFQLNNGNFVLGGCGAGLFINENGSFFANCGPATSGSAKCSGAAKVTFSSHCI